MGAAGNEDSSKVHLQKTFTTDDTCALTLLSLNDITKLKYAIDRWSIGNTPFEVGVGIIDPATGDTLAQGLWHSSDQTQVYEDTIYQNKTFCVAYCNGTNPVNSRRNITLMIGDIPDSTDTYSVALFLKSTAQADVHAWSNDITFVNRGLPGVYLVKVGNHPAKKVVVVK